MEPLAFFDQASAWAAGKVRNAGDTLDQRTPCDGWDVQSLMNHMCDSLRYFGATVAGEEAELDVANPRALLGADAAETYDEYRSTALAAFQGADAQKYAMQMRIAGCDQLIHGWDLAKATGQDTTMPEALAEAAWGVIGGNLPDERPEGSGFKPAINVAENVPSQDRLLAYTGRNP